MNYRSSLHGARYIEQWQKEQKSLTASANLDQYRSRSCTEIGSCFEPPTTPMGYDELAVAGALKGEPARLCKCLTVNERAIANAEYDRREDCSECKSTGKIRTAIPICNAEFRIHRTASDQCWMIKVTAVTQKEPDHADLHRTE